MKQQDLYPLPPAPPTPPAPERKRWSWGKRIGIGALIAVGVIIIGIALFGESETSKDDRAEVAQTAADAENTPVLQAAYDGCLGTLRSTMPHIELTDQGHAVIGDGPRDSAADGAKYVEDIACVLVEVGAPEYVISQMDSTTSLMGRQEASWGELNANWSYHPDNGFDLVIYDNS